HCLCRHSYSCSFCSMLLRPLRSPLFPYTTLFRSCRSGEDSISRPSRGRTEHPRRSPPPHFAVRRPQEGERADGPLRRVGDAGARSEEHTSELQSRVDLVCRLLLEKKKSYAYVA